MPGEKPIIADVVSVSVECADCGHGRWLRPAQLQSFGVSLMTSLEDLASRLSCAPCRLDGLPGKNVVVTAAFVNEELRNRAERWKARTPEVHAWGSLAKGA